MKTRNNGKKKRARFLKSLKYAFRGLLYCVNSERNLRIHTAAALYVFAFSFFFEMSWARYALLFLTFALVISAEVFNTVAEELSDLAAPSYHPAVRIVKDLAAGGVLVCALFAVAVGVCLFWQPDRLWGIVLYFAAQPWRAALLALSLAAALVYIQWGPAGIRDRLARRRAAFHQKKKNP